jgi:hypothetical protein
LYKHFTEAQNHSQLFLEEMDLVVRKTWEQPFGIFDTFSNDVIDEKYLAVSVYVCVRPYF